MKRFEGKNEALSRVIMIAISILRANNRAGENQSMRMESASIPRDDGEPEGRLFDTKGV